MQQKKSPSRKCFFFLLSNLGTWHNRKKFKLFVCFVFITFSVTVDLRFAILFFFVKLCTSSFSKTFPFWNKKLRLSFFEANKLTKVLFFKSKRERGKGRLGFFILGKNNRFNTRFFNTKLFTGQKFFLRPIFPKKDCFFLLGQKQRNCFIPLPKIKKRTSLQKTYHCKNGRQFYVSSPGWKMSDRNTGRSENSVACRL